MAKYLILSLEILFILVFIFYIAIFHSSLSIFAFMFFECMYIILMIISSFLLKKKRYAVVSLIQFFLFVSGLFLIVSESLSNSLREKYILKIAYLSETVFLSAFLMMTCSVFFYIWKLTSAIDEERERQHNGGVASEESSQEDAEEQEEEKNPSIANPQWKNADGEPITKALVGDEVYLCADVQDIPDEASARIKIVEKDADGNDDDVATLTAKVSGGRMECAWKVVYTEDDDDADSEQEKEEKGYTLPEYAFTVECGGAESGESGQLDVRGGLKVQLKDKKSNTVLKNTRISLMQNKSIYKTLTTDEEGYFELLEIPIGKFEIKLERK